MAGYLSWKVLHCDWKFFERNGPTGPSCKVGMWSLQESFWPVNLYMPLSQLVLLLRSKLSEIINLFPEFYKHLKYIFQKTSE